MLALVGSALTSPFCYSWHRAARGDDFLDCCGIRMREARRDFTREMMLGAALGGPPLRNTLNPTCQVSATDPDSCQPLESPRSVRRTCAYAAGTSIDTLQRATSRALPLPHFPQSPDLMLLSLMTLAQRAISLRTKASSSLPGAPLTSMPCPCSFSLTAGVLIALASSS